MQPKCLNNWEKSITIIQKGMIKMNHKSKKCTLDDLMEVACRQYIKSKKEWKRKKQVDNEGKLCEGHKYKIISKSPKSRSKNSF